MITKENIKGFLPDRFRENGENQFFSNRLEAIYVYTNKLKYWEDWRATNIYQEISLPIHNLDFEKLVLQPLAKRQWKK